MPALAALGALLLALLAPATATTWNIFEDGSGDAGTIQDAMTFSEPGDTVLVWPGVYEGRITIPDGVTLISQAGAARTTLRGAGTTAIDAGRSARVEGIVVDGFTITGVFNGGFTEVAHTIHVWGSTVVRNCVIADNFAMVAGAHLRDGDLRIHDTLFLENRGGRQATPWVSGVSCAGGFLVVQRCTFENQTFGAVLRTEGGIVEFRDNFVRNCATSDIEPGTSSLLIFNSLFDRVPYPFLVDGAMPIVIRQNTFARAGEGGAALGPALGSHTVVDRNVITGAWRGLWICCPGVTVTCNDVWGNETNWLGPIDTTGNYSLPPKFCDALQGDFTVAANSPLLPHLNECGEQIGAFGQGCDPLPVESATWTSIKARYRRARTQP